MKSLREALNEVRSLETHPLVKKARKAHKDGVWDGNVDKNGNPIVFINGKPHTVVVEDLQEADMFKVAKEFENYARKSGGIDKKDFMRVAGFLRDIGKNSNVNKQDALFIQMKYYIDKLDTDVRDGMITLFQKNGMVKNNRLTREGLEEMSHRFVFDKAVNLDKAEKIAQKLGMKTDSETTRDYYYLSVDDGGNTGNLLKFLKATDGLHEESIIEMKFNRDGKKIEITKSGPSTKPTFHLKINGKDHGKFDQEKKAMQYVASLKEDDLEEAPKAPKLKGLDMYGAEIRGLRGKTGTMHTATAVKMGPNKLGFKVVDEFGSVETIDLKTFARKFG